MYYDYTIYWLCQEGNVPTANNLNERYLCKKNCISYSTPVVAIPEQWSTVWFFGRVEYLK